MRESVTTVTKWTVYQAQRPFRYIFTQDTEDVEVNNALDTNNTQVQKQYEPEIVESRRLLGKAVGHYHIEAQSITSLMDLSDRVRGVVVKFFGEHTRNKIQLRLVCEMERVDPATEKIITVEQASFNSDQ